MYYYLKYYSNFDLEILEENESITVNVTYDGAPIGCLERKIKGALTFNGKTRDFSGTDILDNHLVFMSFITKLLECCILVDMPALTISAGKNEIGNIINTTWLEGFGMVANFDGQVRLLPKKSILAELAEPFKEQLPLTNIQWYLYSFLEN